MFTSVTHTCNRCLALVCSVVLSVVVCT